jgi:hypothetical protein
VKFGIKVGAMLSSFVLALVCFAGCNSDDTAPAPAGGGAAAGAAKPGPAAAPTTAKPEEKK